jgi:hypothetical protein
MAPKLLLRIFLKRSKKVHCKKWACRKKLFTDLLI